MSIIQKSFIVVVGNSYSVKDALKRYGFRFEGTYKVWYKIASKESFNSWDKELSSDSISVAHVENLSQIPAIIEAHKEFQKEIIVEKGPIYIDHSFTGAIAEVTKWYAKIFKENNNSKFAFRNLKILGVYAESSNAYLVDCEFFGGVACNCGVGGRQLSNAISIATGIGPICAEKLGMPRISNLDDAKIIVEEMHKMSKECGIFKNVWIPKSQIKNIIDSKTQAA